MVVLEIGLLEVVVGRLLEVFAGRLFEVVVGRLFEVVVGRLFEVGVLKVVVVGLSNGLKSSLKSEKCFCGKKKVLMFINFSFESHIFKIYDM